MSILSEANHILSRVTSVSLPTWKNDWPFTTAVALSLLQNSNHGNLSPIWQMRSGGSIWLTLVLPFLAFLFHMAIRTSIPTMEPIPNEANRESQWWESHIINVACPRPHSRHAEKNDGQRRDTTKGWGKCSYNARRNPKLGWLAFGGFLSSMKCYFLCCRNNLMYEDKKEVTFFIGWWHSTTSTFWDSKIFFNRVPLFPEGIPKESFS